MTFLAQLSLVVGWVYVVAWSVHLYPMLYQNYRRKNVKAMTVPYMLAMVSAQLCYGIYIFSLYFSESIHDEYLAKHQVSGTALLLTVRLTVLSCATGDRVLVSRSRRAQHPSARALERRCLRRARLDAVVALCCAVVLVPLQGTSQSPCPCPVGMRCVARPDPPSRQQSSASSILPATALRPVGSPQHAGSDAHGHGHSGSSGSSGGLSDHTLLAYATLWFCISLALLAGWAGMVSMVSVVSLIGSGKAVISVFKYAPQVAHHRQIKSADEWNMASLLLDLTGASGALAQLLLDAWVAGHVDEITANFPKLTLSCVAIWFNLVFLLQRAVLYPKAGDTDK
jgi:uncharacterized protein with PQ loop repeat